MESDNALQPSGVVVGVLMMLALLLFLPSAAAAQQEQADAREAVTAASTANAKAAGPGSATTDTNATPARLPLLRHVDASLQKVRPPASGQLRFLLADDFAPFAWRNRNGALTGYAVAVAQAVCRRARLRCQFIVRPPEKLAAALLNGEGDVIIGGVRPLAAHWRRLDFTRPYFRALGRFAVRRDARLRAATREGFTGRRVAVVKGSVHAYWLARHMGNARLLLAPDFTQAAEHLRQGRADALFADWLQLAFWVRGRKAGDCCRVLPQLFAARTFAYNHLGMAVPAGQRDLRDFLDRQLDLLQEDGELRILARRFLPLRGIAPPRRRVAEHAAPAVTGHDGNREQADAEGR